MGLELAKSLLTEGGDAVRPRDHIGYGIGAGITLKELASIAGVSERMVRKDIEKARCEGEHIVNFQDGRGYYRTDDREVLRRYLRQERARAINQLKRDSKLYKELKENA